VIGPKIGKGPYVSYIVALLGVQNGSKPNGGSFGFAGFLGRFRRLRARWSIFSEMAILTNSLMVVVLVSGFRLRRWSSLRSAARSRGAIRTVIVGLFTLRHLHWFGELVRVQGLHSGERLHPT
jgi:hypothetical protein